MTTPTKHARSHAYAASAFEREAFDPLRMREPVARSATVCNALPWFALPGVLRSPDGDPAPGGGKSSRKRNSTRSSRSVSASSRCSSMRRPQR
jgi:hypothetical protein